MADNTAAADNAVNQPSPPEGPSPTSEPQGTAAMSAEGSSRRGADQQQDLTAVGIAHWLLCPAVFVLGCWVAAVSPYRFEALLPRPRYSWLLGGPPGQKTLHTLMNALPRSMAAAWQLGRIAERLEASPDAADMAVQHAAAVLKVPADRLSPTLLMQLGTHLQELEGRRGITARLAGAFSLVNIIWAAATLGLAVTVGPALAIVCAPLARHMLRLLQHAAAIAQRAAAAIKPVWEALAYLLCLYIIGAANRYPPDVAAMIAGTGCLLALPAFLYSTRLHVKGGGNNSAFAALVNVYLAAVLAPAAASHSSNLLGFLAATAFFGAVGFSVIPLGMCWLVGFNSQDTMLRSAATAAVVLSALLALRVAGIDPQLLAPFQLGLSVWGAITLFLAGLIMASLYYDRPAYWRETDREEAARRFHRRYIAYNAGYATVLVAGVTAGTLTGLPPLTNTSITFGLLWAAEKGAEAAGTKRLWLTGFVISAALWQAALFLRSNPGWLVTLVSW